VCGLHQPYRYGRREEEGKIISVTSSSSSSGAVPWVVWGVPFGTARPPQEVSAEHTCIRYKGVNEFSLGKLKANSELFSNAKQNIIIKQHDTDGIPCSTHHTVYCIYIYIIPVTVPGMYGMIHDITRYGIIVRTLQREGYSNPFYKNRNRFGPHVWFNGSTPR